MASEALSLFPSPVSSIPPKSCLRHAEEVHARRHTPSPILAPKSYPSGKLQGLASQFMPQSGGPVRACSPTSIVRPSRFASPQSGRSPDCSVLRSSPGSYESPATYDDGPAIAVRKVSIETTASDTRSDLSGPTLVRSNSDLSTKPKVASPPMQSIFPEYDPSLPLSQQHYYPSEHAPRPGIQRRGEYYQSPVNAPSPSSPVPAAGLSQLQALWNAASGQNASFHSDKIRLAMHCDEIKSATSATDLRFGSREGRTIYSVSAAEATPKLTIRRHHPARTGIVPVAQVELGIQNRDHQIGTTIFPQQAALSALEAAAKTRRANAIAQYDPRASSPQAAQLALDAVGEAKAQESCQLVRLTEGCNGYDGSDHEYELRHPQAGVFDIITHGAISLTLGERHMRSGLITLHHGPTRADKTFKRAALVSFDISSGTLDIDVASLKCLSSSHMIDSAVCAILAVAFMEENSGAAQMKAETKTFEAPPTVTTEKPGRPNKKLRRSRWRRLTDSKDSTSGTVSKDSEKQKERKLPGVTRGILYMLGFSFEAIVWLLKLGVKIISKIVSCAGQSTKK